MENILEKILDNPDLQSFLCVPPVRVFLRAEKEGQEKGSYVLSCKGRLYGLRQPTVGGVYRQSYNQADPARVHPSRPCITS